MRLRLPFWWYIAPAYLTLWTICFSLWNFVDGNGMMIAFGVDTGGASDFIMLNSAARYIAIGVAMILGIWVFRTFASILTALVTWLVMDLLDLVAGLQTGLITDGIGVAQSFIMFLGPNLFAIATLVILTRRARPA
ncbi:hypothetical protein QTO30_19255 [Yoonia sp. GPGPB17]|uniref:hypothetical protein n=1 Tax=Yoonia sp. GPGPB17 TaxID=3026147 RepID=UPI0030C27727